MDRAPTRTAVAWGSSPLADRGQFETLSATHQVREEGESWRHPDRTGLSYGSCSIYARVSHRFAQSIVVHQDSSESKDKLAEFG